MAPIRRNRRGLSRALLASLAALLAVLGGPVATAPGAGAQEEEAGGDRAGGAAWTVLVYLLADNNLEPDMMADVEEMVAAGTGDDVNFIVLADRSAEYSNQDYAGLGDFDTTKLIQIRDGRATELEDYGEVDMGDPQTLAWFVNSGLTRFPAQRYGLVLSDHAAGWVGYGHDEGSDTGFDLAEISAGIEGGLQGTGVDRFDLLGYDACLMATYEVAAESANYAEYLLASEEVEPDHGWNHEAWRILADNPDAGPAEVGQALIQGFQGQAQQTGNEATITLSLTDLKQVGAAQQAVANLASALAANIDTVAPVVARERASALTFGATGDPAQDFHLVDLGDLLARMGADVPPDVDVARQALFGTLRAMVVDQVTGAGTASATGLSIYFPPSSDFYLSDRYGTINDATGWRTFLESFFQAGADVPASQAPEFVNPNGEASLSPSPEGVIARGQLATGTETNVSEVQFAFGTVEAGGEIVFAGIQPGFFTQTRGEVAGGWDFRRLELTDGAATSPAYFEVTPREDVLIIDVPIRYDSPTREDVFVVLELVANAQSGAVVQSTLLEISGEGVAAPLNPERGSTLRPLVLVASAQGAELRPSATRLDATAAVDFAFRRLPAGAPYFVQLAAIDFAGNVATVSGTGTVP